MAGMPDPIVGAFLLSPHGEVARFTRSNDEPRPREVPAAVGVWLGWPGWGGSGGTNRRSVVVLILLSQTKTTEPTEP
jgi:hypothetical protein